MLCGCRLIAIYLHPSHGFLVSFLRRFRETAASEMSAFALIRKFRIVLTGNDDGTLRMWNLESGQHSITKGHTNTVSTMATAWTGRSPDDPTGRDLVFTCGFDGDILTW